MNYQRLVAVCGLSVLPCTVLADLSSVFDGGWRVSAGAVYDSGVKTDVKYAPRQTYSTPYSVSPGAMTRAQAREAAWGTKSGTRTTYVNARTGAESWGDTTDAATGRSGGHDAGKTTNYRFDAAGWDENTAFELGYAEYQEVSSQQASFESMKSRDRDDSAMPGFNVQLSRNLYHDDENHWGVEGAFAFQYARRNNVLKSSSAWGIGSSQKKSGSYSATYNATGDLASLLTYGGADAGYVHDYVWNGDGGGEYIGGGGQDGFASPVDMDDIERTWGGEQTQSHAECGSLSAKGDYDNMELMLLLQPYYDVCDWFSVNATLGLVVSRQSMDMSFSMFRNGISEYRSSKRFDQWDVYGVAGLGAMFYYRGFTLSGDFMARFFDREMDIKDKYYKGTVERGDWLFRLGLGYEF